MGFLLLTLLAVLDLLRSDSVLRSLVDPSRTWRGDVAEERARDFRTR